MQPTYRSPYFNVPKVVSTYRSAATPVSAETESKAFYPPFHDQVPAWFYRNTDYLPPQSDNASDNGYAEKREATSRKDRLGIRRSQNPERNPKRLKQSGPEKYFATGVDYVQTRDITSPEEVAVLPVYKDFSDYMCAVTCSEQTLRVAKALIQVGPDFKNLNEKKERVFYNLIQCSQNKFIGDEIRQQLSELIKKLNEADAFVGLNFRGFNFSGWNLPNLNLTGCLFIGADLRVANLEDTQLAYTSFFRANLQSTILNEADMSHANLEGADFQYAALNDTCFDKSWMAGAMFDNAKMTRIDLTRAHFEGHKNNPVKFGPPTFTGAEIVEVRATEEQINMLQNSGQ